MSKLLEELMADIQDFRNGEYNEDTPRSVSRPLLRLAALDGSGNDCACFGAFLEIDENGRGFLCFRALVDTLPNRYGEMKSVYEFTLKEE